MAASEPRIKTTVVGSYPVPDWLINNPSEQALADATRVVLHTQEHAGIDVVCDGELYRFDPEPSRNQRHDRVFRAADGGGGPEIGFDELTKYRSQKGMQFRTRRRASSRDRSPPATLDLPGACRSRGSSPDAPFKFTLTGPHMLAKTLVNRHYGGLPANWRNAIADVLAEQVRHLDADVVQLDEANLPGAPTSGNGRRPPSTGCSTP